jgi:hypothetical protein
MSKTTKAKKPDKYALDSDFTKSLFDDIRSFIQAGTEQKDTEDKFTELALRLFEYQYNANEPYKKYCNKRGVKPGDIDDWKLIPFVAANAFKEVPLTTFPPDDAVKVFLSSGTTNPEKRSKVYLNQAGLDMYDLSLRQSIEAYYYTSPAEKLHIMFMCPTPDALPHDAAILHVPRIVIENHYIGEPHFLITREGLDIKFLVERLRQAESDGEAVAVMGPSFGFMHFFDYCSENDITFKLPPGSRLVDGGGYKGRSRELSKEDFLDLANRVTGIEPHMLNNVYSMTEIQTLFPDNVLYNHLRGIKEPRYKVNPPWTKILVVDPDTLEPLPKGKQGLMRYYCLASIVTVQALQSDDIGYETGSGFEVVGRAKGAEARGCSIAVDELLSVQTE